MKNIDPMGLSAPTPGLYTRTCIPPFSNIVFSQTAWPIEGKFYVKPPLEGGKKVYINGLGHNTKIAATPMYGKKLQNSFPTELIVL